MQSLVVEQYPIMHTLSSGSDNLTSIFLYSDALASPGKFHSFWTTTEH